MLRLPSMQNVQEKVLNKFSIFFVVQFTHIKSYTNWIVPKWAIKDAYTNTDQFIR